MPQVQLPFAVDKHGNTVSIFDVANGRACNCTCPACEAPLTAKQKVRKWHFAHVSGSPCGKAGYESALHLAVKKIIEQERKLLLPPVRVICSIENSATEPSYNYQKDFVFGSPEPVLRQLVDGQLKIVDCGIAEFLGEFVSFDEVLTEQADGDIRPDLIGIAAGQRYFIEVAVSHLIDADKLQKIRQRRTPTIELLFTANKEQINWESLRRVVTASIDGKIWRHHPEAESLAKDRLNTEIERRKTITQWSRQVGKNLKTGQLIELTVRLCLACTSITCKPKNAAFDATACTIASRLNGVFNKTREQWEFPSSDAIFTAIVSAIKELKVPAFPSRLSQPRKTLAEDYVFRESPDSLRRRLQLQNPQFKVTPEWPVFSSAYIDPEEEEKRTSQAYAKATGK